MDSPFVYTKPAAQEYFLGRQREVDWLGSNLNNGQHSLLAEPPRTGKQSLVQQTFAQLQHQGAALKFCELSLFNVRSFRDLALQIALQAAAAFANTLEDWKALCANLLPLNASRVKINETGMPGPMLILPPTLAQDQIQELLELPQSLCTHFQERRLVVHIKDFHNILLLEDFRPILAGCLKTWKTQPAATYLLSASKVNALRDFRCHNTAFDKLFEQIPLAPIEEKTLIDYMIKGFAKAGRVISKDLAELVYRKTEGHPFYTQHLAHLCFINTKGYMNEAMFDQAYRDLLDVHHRDFCALTNDLTDSQLSFLRAVTHGVERFCMADVMDTYQLHSSANVNRIRTALEKKEVLSFYRNKPAFLDPLFKRWFIEKYLQESL